MWERLAARLNTRAAMEFIFGALLPEPPPG
jgi:hypothetical protein